MKRHYWSVGEMINGVRNDISREQIIFSIMKVLGKFYYGRHL